jgi:hypothetical protein
MEARQGRANFQALQARSHGQDRRKSGDRHANGRADRAGVRIRGSGVQVDAAMELRGQKEGRKQQSQNKELLRTISQL